MRWGTTCARLGALLLALAALAALAPAGVAEAHASVDHSDPAAGSTVATAPSQVKVWFSEPVDGTASTLSVVDAMGMPVDLHDSALDASDQTLVTVSLPASLPNGVYTVKWAALTADGGKTSGEFQFGVGAAVPAAAPATTVPTGGVDAGLAIMQPVDGATVTGSDLPLMIETHGVTFVAMGSEAAAPAGTLGGHLHISVDGAQIGMVTTGEGLVVHNLANGSHEIVVALAAPNHLPYDPPIEASARITVTGSTATGAASLTAGGMPPMTMAPAQTGMAGLAATRGGSPALVALLIGAAAALVLGARRLGARRAAAARADRT